MLKICEIGHVAPPIKLRIEIAENCSFMALHSMNRAQCDRFSVILHICFIHMS
jgi:hypothetical protein